MELEDVSLLLEAPEQANVAIPDGAVDLFPRKIGRRILYLSDQDQILKAGPSVKMSEAEAMRYVALHTSIPVPKVQESYTRNGCGYIFMSKAGGEPLADVWKELDLGQGASVVRQLQKYVQELQSLTGEFYGALWDQACEDTFINHLPFHHVKVHYGPYYSRQQFNDGLVTALQNSGPTRSLDEFEQDISERIQAVTDGKKTFPTVTCIH